MRNIRLIARLDIKGDTLIKGVHMEGLRVLGDPQKYAKHYYEQEVDELIYMDIVASLYGRNKLTEILISAAKEVFIPMTVGGGIRNLDDVSDLLNAGADKVAINTAAVRRPGLISEISHAFGSQCMVLSVEAKKQEDGRWEVYTDCGRERTGMDVLEWVRKGEDLGAGEILITSIDRDGTKEGMDLELLSAVCNGLKIPVIASGGCASTTHAKNAIDLGADAIAIGAALHSSDVDLISMRSNLCALGYSLRSI
jgi:cyclase